LSPSKEFSHIKNTGNCIDGIPLATRPVRLIKEQLGDAGLVLWLALSLHGERSLPQSIKQKPDLLDLDQEKIADMETCLNAEDNRPLHELVKEHENMILINKL
jgi:hypothetical protein